MDLNTEQKQARERLQVSEREFMNLLSNFDSFMKELLQNGSGVSYEKVQKAKAKQEKAEEYQNKKQQAQDEHNKKGFLKRGFSSPRYVGQAPWPFEVKNLKSTVEKLARYEGKFTYLCDAHRLDHASTFRTLADVSRYGGIEVSLDAYRAYQNAQRELEELGL